MNKRKKERIGIFSGSFDPPHKGHMHIAKLFIKKLKLKKLIWSVSKKNPLLKKKYYNSYSERISLSKLITKKYKKIIINNFDKKYSYQLVNSIKKKYYNNKLYFLIGSDNAQNLHKWKNLSKLMNSSTMVVINRPGYKKEFKKLKNTGLPVLFLNDSKDKVLNQKITFSLQIKEQKLKGKNIIAKSVV